MLPDITYFKIIILRDHKISKYTMNYDFRRALRRGQNTATGQRRAMTAISQPVPEGLATAKPQTDATTRETADKGRCGEVDCELYVNTIKQDIFDKH